MPNFGSLSRKRLQEIGDLLKTMNISDDQSNDILKGICKIVNYNPEECTYTQSKGQKSSAWRAKRAEQLGISTSQIANGNYKKIFKEM